MELEELVSRYIRIWFFNVLVALILASLFAACGYASTDTVSASPDPVKHISTSSSSTNLMSNTSSSSVPLKVKSVNINVNPSSLSNYTCGSTITETYTATFHFPVHNAGGQVKFEYTTNNGRASEPASLTVKAGQTSAIYTFYWSGPLPADHTAPGPGGVMVTSPNSYTSTLVAPSGACSPATSAPFKVDSIGLTASPPLTGHACGSFFTETYTATFHIAAGSPGGTIVFQYTTNNGRSSSPNVSLAVAPGQTTATYTFTWSGSLPADHTAPGVGIVMASAPNQLISQSAVPSGTCS
jgi:hypothetical protein